MAVVDEWVRYGDQLAYLALHQHAAAPLPGVVLIHDLIGLDEYAEDVARRIAAAGYAVLAPDLFAVDGARPPYLARDRVAEAMGFLSRQPAAALSDRAVRASALAELPEPERLRVDETISGIFAFGAPPMLQSLLGPLRLAVRYLRDERPETRGQRVASVGEGLSALLACAEPELSGAVVFYGITPPAESLRAIGCPVLAFYGARDTRINAGIAAFDEGMRAVGLPFEWHVYEGAGHGFFNDTKPAYYDVAASRDAFARLLMFLLTTLTSPASSTGAPAATEVGDGGRVEAGPFVLPG
ncbi:MAG: dienelactone hydrolase family protein [Candidatus Limnocylindrales bacterium]|jgi:carboxymethylenebutenolidase